MSDPDFGDIAGLHGVAATLQKAAPDLTTAVHVLDTQVKDLTNDAWTGRAAEAFTAKWGKDATGAQAVGAALKQIGTTVRQLASALEQAKKQYDNAVATAAEQHVPLLQPGEQTVLPSNVVAKSEELSAQANSAVTMADAARQEASAALAPLMAVLNPAATAGPMTPQEATELDKLGLSDYVKLGAGVADLYAVPAVATTLQSARAAKLEKLYVQAKNAYSVAGGKSAPRSEYALLKQAKKDSLGKLKSARADEVDAEKLADKFPGSRAAATDLEETLDKIGADLSKFKIFKAAPLVDVLATGYSVYQDVHDSGWSPLHAVVADSADTLAGIGAAAGVMAIVATAPIDVPVIAVAGVGAIAGYEGTEAATALTHDGHWGANIHQYGVVAGIGQSFEDAGSAFVKDNVETGKKIRDGAVGLAQKAWHGLTSFF
jgi:WXG100 family type VII secretion target